MNLSKDLHLNCSSNLLDSDGTRMYLISKVISFDGNMRSARAIFGILVGNFESSLIVFVHVGLKLLGNDVRPGAANTASQGWMWS